MASRLLHLSAALLCLPSVALAGEPSRGTVITIASVGAWLIISSVGIVLRSKRGERPKANESANPDQKA